MTKQIVKSLTVDGKHYELLEIIEAGKTVGVQWVRTKRGLFRTKHFMTTNAEISKLAKHQGF